MFVDKDAEKIINMLNKLPENKIKEMLASIAGITVEEQEENSRKFEDAKKYHNLPIDQWPDFEIKWDLKKENRRFALDNFDEATYRKNYPEGFIVGWVDFKEFNLKLATHSQRTKEQIWETSLIAKLAKTILYYVEGNAMTPPLICLDKNKNSVMVGGGNHRIAVCLARDVEKIPILVMPSEKNNIENILTSIEWQDE